ncbi:MAG: carbohydrate ABC transporter permease [Candidatus Omnitrophica bacterium]|nr:carbohydrate ABC transporter permease [Candidatus Omnitrophota bacterium]
MINRFILEKRLKSVVMHLILLSVAATCILPLIWMFSSSLKTQDTIFSNMHIIVSDPHWENYREAWTKGNFGAYFLNSVIYTVSVVGGVVFTASLAAFAFARLNFPGKNIMFYMFLITMMIPIPGSFIALYVLLQKLRLVNTRLGYILPQINAGLALAIYILKTFFEELPKDLEDSARIDGCGKFGVYWHIAMPLAKPAIAVIVVFNAMAVWNEYLLAMLILSSKSLMPLQRGLMVFQGAHITRYPLLMAGITIAVVPIVVLYLIMQRHIITGITAGAVKG